MSRQIQYELLAMALSYPSYELLAAIKDGEFDRVFACQAPVPSSLEEMEIEYCRMFVGPGHVEAPPYESVYRGNDINLQKGCVMGPPVAEVKKIYAESGLQLADGFADMPDHIAVETWFLAYLEAMTAVDPEGQYAETKKRFLTQHIGQWITPFYQAVQQHGKHSWYKYTVDMLHNIIQEEMN
jgi:TorA maturation chaperone TorD